jgi:hypothetical protein
VREVATVDGDLAAPACERCYADLHPGVAVVVSYWSVSEASYGRTTLEDRLPFTVIRSRKIAGHLGGRDEMYRPQLSQDGDVRAFTSVLVEEARDGSSFDVEEVSEDAARAIMKRTRAQYLPG